MSVYVDSAAQWGNSNSPRCFRNQPSCHMYADTLEELHAMALKIGLKRSWFQQSRRLRLPHYDLVPSRREAAVKAGAVVHTMRQMVMFSRAWKEIAASPVPHV